MIKEVQREEWWAELVGSQVCMARLHMMTDGSCEVLDIDGTTHAFGSYVEATTWLQEDEYERVSDLISDDELPSDFRLPSGTNRSELLEEMRGGGAQLQPFLDRKLFESLGTERHDVQCMRPGCSNGAIEASRLCRHHHFENVTGRTCPRSVVP